MVPNVSVVGCDIVDGAACGLGGAYTEFRIRVGDAYVFRRYSQFRSASAQPSRVGQGHAGKGTRSMDDIGDVVHCSAGGSTHN